MGKRKDQVFECKTCKEDMTHMDLTMLGLYYTLDKKVKSIDDVPFCSKDCAKKYIDKVCDVLMMLDNVALMKDWVCKKYLEDRNGTHALDAKCMKHLNVHFDGTPK